MPKKRKTKFTIGDIVKVDLENRVVSRYIDHDGKIQKVMQRFNQDSIFSTRYKEVVKAVVTGLKRFVEGEYYAPERSFYGYGSSYEEYDTGGVIHENTIQCWAVRTGYLNKEFYFFEKDIRMIQSVDQMYFVNDDSRDEIPLLYTGWNDKYRKQMSRESKDWPRDERGRFCK
jgi:hypothetical protein